MNFNRYQDRYQGIILSLLILSTLSGLIAHFCSSPDGWWSLGYFTIQSNFIALVYACITFVYIIIRKNKSIIWPQLAGFVTLATTITMLVYNILLSDWKDPFFTAVGYANWQLHIIAPLLMLVYFFFFSPKVAIPYKMVFYWLIYPLIYAVGSIVGGLVGGWYPYWFIDVSQLGWAKVIPICLLLLVGFLALGLTIIVLNNKVKQA